MRLLLVGDTHGNDRFFAQMCKLAVERQCDRIIQLGDFGYWEHYTEGKRYLKWCERQLAEKNLTCYWLDGNHENHPLLWGTYGPGGPQHRPDRDGFWRIREGLYYMPRGHRWVWDDVSFLAVGGAASVDKEYRKEGKSWWATELITPGDVEVASAGGKVDVLFSHDVPEGVEIPSLYGQEKNKFPISRANREVLLEVVKATCPYFLAHGHYHDRYSDTFTYPINDEATEWARTHVEGLGADMSAFSDTALVFDTEAFRATLGR